MLSGEGKIEHHGGKHALEHSSSPHDSPEVKKTQNIGRAPKHNAQGPLSSTGFHLLCLYHSSMSHKIMDPSIPHPLIVDPYDPVTSTLLNLALLGIKASTCEFLGAGK